MNNLCNNVTKGIIYYTREVADFQDISCFLFNYFEKSRPKNLKGRKQIMKKIIALVLCLLLACSVGLTAFAAGVDDGTVKIATKNGEKFFGTESTEGLIKYEAANGSGEVFYDLNGDKEMDICDLVALKNGSVDFDLSGTFDSADSAALRLILIGGAN